MLKVINFEFTSRALVYGSVDVNIVLNPINLARHYVATTHLIHLLRGFLYYRDHLNYLATV